MLVPAATAGAAFAPTDDRIAAGEQIDGSGLATDGQGNALIAWHQKQTPTSNYESKARRMATTGALGPIIDLSAPGAVAFRPILAMTPAGRAFVAWREFADFGPSSVVGRWINTDGSLGPVLTIVAGSVTVDAIDPKVAIDSSGVATVAWRDQNGGGLGLRRIFPDSTLGTAVPSFTASGDDHSIVALPNGGTLAVWRGSGTEKSVVATNNAFAAPVQISSVGNSTASPQLTTDSIGNGLAVWREDTGLLSIRGRRLSPSGAAVGAELIIDPDQAGFSHIDVNVTADSADDFIVSWDRQDAEGDHVTYARPINSGGVFSSAAQPISSGLFSSSLQQVALEDRGSAAAVWNNDIGMTSIISGRTLDSQGAPTGPIQDLFVDGTGTNSVSHAPAAGVAVFLTDYPTSASTRAVVARRYMVPPTCSDSNAVVVQGNPIAAALACSGPAVEGAEIVDQPKHGKVGAFGATGPTLGYTPTPGFEGDDSFTYRAINDGGSSGVARVAIKVGKDTVKPAITSLRFVQSANRSARASASKKRKAAKRTYSFALKYSEASTAVVTVERGTRGLRKGKRCRKPTKGARGKRCTIYRSIGTASTKTAATAATVGATGKLARRLAKGGRYRASAVATDLAGNKSKTKRVTIRAKRQSSGR